MEKLRNFLKVYLKQASWALVALCLPTAAFAAPAADQMLMNLQMQLPYLFALVSGFAYVAGTLFIFKGIYTLKEYGESRMMGSQRNIKEAIALLIIGAMLIYIPTAKNILLTSVYGSDSVMAYASNYSDNGFTMMGQIIVSIVQFVGFLAFIRGLIKMHKVGAGQAQQGEFNKGITHLVGGAIAMNVVGFVKIITYTLGID